MECQWLQLLIGPYMVSISQVGKLFTVLNIQEHGVSDLRDQRKNLILPKIFQQ